MPCTSGMHGDMHKLEEYYNRKFIKAAKSDYWMGKRAHSKLLFEKVHYFFLSLYQRGVRKEGKNMDILIQISSGNLDTIIPGLVMATRLKNEGADVAVSFQWRALVAFAEKEFAFSQQVSKYVTRINDNAAKMGFPVDPMKYLDGAKADGIPLFGCAVEAEICGIKEKIPQEIELVEESDITNFLLEAKKVISGF